MAASAQDAPPKTSPGFGGDSADAATGAGQPGFRYEYMFAKDKSPTKQLDAILRAVARYIVRLRRLLTFVLLLFLWCCRIISWSCCALLCCRRASY